MLQKRENIALRRCMHLEGKRVVIILSTEYLGQWPTGEPPPQPSFSVHLPRTWVAQVSSTTHDAPESFHYLCSRLTFALVARNLSCPHAYKFEALQPHVQIAIDFIVLMGARIAQTERLQGIYDALLPLSREFSEVVPALVGLGRGPRREPYCPAHCARCVELTQRRVSCKDDLTCFLSRWQRPRYGSVET
jgi:hypothetical protein